MYLPWSVLQKPPFHLVLDVQILDVLEAVTQVAEERVVEMLEHPSLSNDISHAL
jgi:hypothetical protein